MIMKEFNNDDYIVKNILCVDKNGELIFKDVEFLEKRRENEKDIAKRVKFEQYYDTNSESYKKSI
jgi:hypothetical protein